jgi:hypothetical protein
MQFRTIILSLLAAAALFTAGCSRHAPIYNVENESVIVGKTSYSAEEVKKAIILAGASLGWSIKEVAPGELEGALYIRKHMAQVDIPYSTESYSIYYKDSDNLKYDGSGIHSNYNGWIQNLDRAIKTHLGAIH